MSCQTLSAFKSNMRHNGSILGNLPYPKTHLEMLASLKSRLKSVFIVLVGHTDGMVCMHVDEALTSLNAAFGS
jgi:hypothetical protein